MDSGLQPRGFGGFGFGVLGPVRITVVLFFGSDTFFLVWVNYKLRPTPKFNQIFDSVFV